MNGLIDVRNEGYKDYIQGNAKLNANEASNTKILNFLVGNASDQSLDQKNLFPFHKLLFQIVSQFILHRTSKRTQASLMDLS